VDLGPWHVTQRCSRVGGRPTARLLLLLPIAVLAAHIFQSTTRTKPQTEREAQ